MHSPEKFSLLVQFSDSFQLQNILAPCRCDRCRLVYGHMGPILYDFFGVVEYCLRVYLVGAQIFHI
jgi:hypothetical protein